VRRKNRLAMVSLAICAALVGGGSGTSTGQDAAQGAVGVAEGSDGLVHWDISVYRQGTSWCVVGKAHGDGVWTDKLSCEHFVPRNLWGGPVVVRTARSTAGGAVLFFFVDKRVGRLSVRAAKAKGSGYRSFSVPVERLPKAQVAAAGFDQAIAFGVVQTKGLKEFAGGVCLRGVKTFARSGKLIEQSPPIICLDSSSPD
jgi:hypothetical protein